MTFAQPSDPFGLNGESRVDETGIRWSNHTPPRPYIKDPVSGKETLYARVTSWLDCIEDRSGLETWKQWIILAGLIASPDLLQRLPTVDPTDKKELAGVVTEAFRAGDGLVAASKGTNLHALSELVDDPTFDWLNWPPGTTDADIADMVAYRRAMEDYGIEMLATEKRVVLDDLKVTGTFDRIVRFQGRNVCGDLKTGSISYAQSKLASQLALYVHGQVYDPATGERKPFRNIDIERGLVFHLPQGEARCDIYEVDLVLGWEAVQLVKEIRAMRKRSKDAIWPLSDWTTVD